MSILKIFTIIKKKSVNLSNDLIGIKDIIAAITTSNNTTGNINLDTISSNNGNLSNTGKSKNLTKSKNLAKF